MPEFVRPIKALDTSPPDHPYTPDQRRRALEPYLTSETDGGWSSGYCPVCERPDVSKSPSASFEISAGAWKCHKSDECHGMPLDTVIKHHTAYGRKGAPPAGRWPDDTPAQTATPALRPLENQDLPHEWHDRLMTREPERLQYLTTQRGLTVETIERFKVGWDGQRYTIPIRQGLGLWHNVRRYLPGVEPKMLNLKDHGAAALAFTETMAGNTLPVLVTEGELDAMLAWQEAGGLYAVVTGTGGASTVSRDLSLLSHREVFVCYDNDNAGHKGAENFVRRARGAGATAHRLDVRALGVEAGHLGGDVTDAFMRYGATGSDVLAQMEKARAPARGPERFRVFSAAELAEPVPPMDWLVRGVWPAGSYGVVGGEKKSLKTYTTLSLALAVASGEPLFGRFPVPQARRVLMYLGEGGRAPTQRRLQRLAASRGLDLAALPLGLSFDAGNVLGEDFEEAFGRAVREAEPGLVILDPLYAFHPPGVEAQNLYDRGAMLTQVQALMPEGSALMIVDHFRKGIGRAAVDLDAIAQSGMAQWSDSWLLQWHESPPVVDLGEFHIGMQFGSRQWGGSQYVADWSIGRFDAVAGEHEGPLSVEVRDQAWGTDRASENRSGKQAEVAAAVLELVTAEPLAHTKTTLRDTVTARRKIGKDTFDATWAGLEAERHITFEKADGPGGRRNRWRITTPEERKLRLNGGAA